MKKNSDKKSKSIKEPIPYSNTIPYSNPETDTEAEAKIRKRNIKMMVILIILFLIGILTRWDYITSEIDIDRYINPNKSITDTINKQ